VLDSERFVADSSLILFAYPVLVPATAPATGLGKRGGHSPQNPTCITPASKGEREQRARVDEAAKPVASRKDTEERSKGGRFKFLHAWTGTTCPPPHQARIGLLRASR
jgi:hypothetical protein